MEQLVGLISFKASLITLAGKVMGLSNAESVPTGFLLSQGGEFAFAVLSLAAKLNVLPERRAVEWSGALDKMG